jgi:hypothetical protein
LRSVCVNAVPVRTPFINIARHIIYIQLVPFLGLDIVRAIIRAVFAFIVSIHTVPSHCVYVVAAAILIARAFLAATCGELPLRLCGQCEPITGRQLIPEFLVE